MPMRSLIEWMIVWGSRRWQRTLGYHSAGFGSRHLNGRLSLISLAAEAGHQTQMLQCWLLRSKGVVALSHGNVSMPEAIRPIFEALF